MDLELIAVGVVFATISIVFVALFINRTKQEEARQKTLQRAVESGQKLTPELVETLSKSIDPEVRDYRRGILLILFAAAFFIVVTSIDIGGSADDVFQYLGLFPLFIGAGYLFVWKTGGGKK